MAVLVTGGAGYIGSVTVELLRKAGREVVVLDSLYRGHREAVDADVPFYHGHTGDRRLVDASAGITASFRACTSPRWLTWANRWSSPRTTT